SCLRRTIVVGSAVRLREEYTAWAGVWNTSPPVPIVTTSVPRSHARTPRSRMPARATPPASTTRINTDRTRDQLTGVRSARKEGAAKAGPCRGALGSVFGEAVSLDQCRRRNGELVGSSGMLLIVPSAATGILADSLRAVVG